MLLSYWVQQLEDDSRQQAEAPAAATTASFLFLCCTMNSLSHLSDHRALITEAMLVSVGNKKEGHPVVLLLPATLLPAAAT